MRMSPVSDGLRGSGRKVTSASSSLRRPFGISSATPCAWMFRLAAAERHGVEFERAVERKRAAIGETAHAVERPRAGHRARSVPTDSDRTRRGSAIAISAPSSMMRPSSSGFANVPSMRVLTSALPSNATALVNAERTRRSTRPFTDRSSGGSSAARPTVPPKVSGFSATSHDDVGHRDVAFRELDA